MSKSGRLSIPVIGWREWVGLPELGIKRIRVKVDTGARSSSLHAYDLEEFERDGETFVRFKVHPVQRKTARVVQTEARVLEYRNIRSSSGKSSRRPVIITTISLLGKLWQVELTLANRNQMGFRMLLGREAFRGVFLVDAGASYFGGKPKRKKKKPVQTGLATAINAENKIDVETPTDREPVIDTDEPIAKNPPVETSSPETSRPEKPAPEQEK